MVRLKDSSLQGSSVHCGPAAACPSWQHGCVTKHPEFPNLAIPLELLAFSSLHFSPFLYNKDKQSKQSHLLMTPVLFLSSQDAAEQTRPLETTEIWLCRVSILVGLDLKGLFRH